MSGNRKSLAIEKKWKNIVELHTRQGHKRSNGRAQASVKNKETREAKEKMWINHEI